jgi:hypothetical protein
VGRRQRAMCRARRNLLLVPAELRATYLELVAAVRLLPRPNRNLRAVHRQLTEICPDLLNPVHCILDHGEPGLRQQYFIHNGLPGRLDVNLPFTNLQQLLQFAALAAVHRPLPKEMRQTLQRLKQTKTFILFTDLVVTGLSLIGDAQALRQLVASIGGIPDPIFVAAPMACTKSGATRLATQFDAVVYGQWLPMALSLCHPECKLGPGSLQDGHVQALVQWFRSEVVVSGDLVERMEQTMGMPSYGLWGFGSEGWLLTGYENTPNNAPPLLWHAPEGSSYIPPFPRTSSRLYHSAVWNLNGSYWEIIRSGTFEDCDD